MRSAFSVKAAGEWAPRHRFCSFSDGKLHIYRGTDSPDAEASHVVALVQQRAFNELTIRTDDGTSLMLQATAADIGDEWFRALSEAAQSTTFGLVNVSMSKAWSQRWATYQPRSRRLCLYKATPLEGGDAISSQANRPAKPWQHQVKSSGHMSVHFATRVPEVPAAAHCLVCCSPEGQTVMLAMDSAADLTMWLRATSAAEPSPSEPSIAPSRDCLEESTSSAPSTSATSAPSPSLAPAPQMHSVSRMQLSRLSIIHEEVRKLPMRNRLQHASCALIEGHEAAEHVERRNGEQSDTEVEDAHADHRPAAPIESTPPSDSLSLMHMAQLQRVNEQIKLLSAGRPQQSPMEIGPAQSSGVAADTSPMLQSIREEIARQRRKLEAEKRKSVALLRKSIRWQNAPVDASGTPGQHSPGLAARAARFASSLAGQGAAGDSWRESGSEDDGGGDDEELACSHDVDTDVAFEEGVSERSSIQGSIGLSAELFAAHSRPILSAEEREQLHEAAELRRELANIKEQLHAALTESAPYRRSHQTPGRTRIGMLCVCVVHACGVLMVTPASKRQLTALALGLFSVRACVRACAPGGQTSNSAWRQGRKPLRRRSVRLSNAS